MEAGAPCFPPNRAPASIQKKGACMRKNLWGHRAPTCERGAPVRPIGVLIQKRGASMRERRLRST